MTVSAVTSSSELNAAVNEPGVLAAVAPGFAEFDLSDFLSDPRNVALRCGDAVAIFEYCAPGVYDGHYLFPKNVRGKVALQAARKIIHEMFTKYRAIVITGSIPREHRAARCLTRALGFQKSGESTDATDEGCVDYELRRDEWVKSSV